MDREQRSGLKMSGKLVAIVVALVGQETAMRAQWLHLVEVPHKLDVLDVAIYTVD